MHSKFSRVYLPKMKLAFGLFFVVLVIIFLIKVTLGARAFIETTGVSPVMVAQLFLGSGSQLSMIDGRTNILLLGIPGGDHAGADLTDTMLVLSFRAETKTLTMVSLPRDLWSDTLKDKINSAYHYGEAKKKGGGIVLAKAIVSDVVGLPIEYGLVFDFSKFRDIINTVGGVEVNVPKAFTDPEFPVPGRENDECDGDTAYACRYEALRFEKGVQVMDGDRALKYVRSRHAEGDEGSDFARSKRQQEVLLALKNKITSKEVVRQPSVVANVYKSFDSATDTDMNIGELLTVGKLFVDIPNEQVYRISLEKLLYAPPQVWYGRYVLLPVDSFEAIHTYVQKELK